MTGERFTAPFEGVGATHSQLVVYDGASIFG